MEATQSLHNGLAGLEHAEGKKTLCLIRHPTLLERLGGADREESCIASSAVPRPLALFRLLIYARVQTRNS